MSKFERVDEKLNSLLATVFDFCIDNILLVVFIFK